MKSYYWKYEQSLGWGAGGNVLCSTVFTSKLSHAVIVAQMKVLIYFFIMPNSIQTFKSVNRILFLCRDAPHKYSTVPFDMEPEILPEGSAVPIHQTGSFAPMNRFVCTNEMTFLIYGRHHPKENFLSFFDLNTCHPETPECWNWKFQ